MKKLILMLFLVVGGVMSASADNTATVYVKVLNGEAPFLYAWDHNDDTSTDTPRNGEWPGIKMTETETIGDDLYYRASFSYEQNTYRVILNDGNGHQCGNIYDLFGSSYMTYSISEDKVTVGKGLSYNVSFANTENWDNVYGYPYGVTHVDGAWPCTKLDDNDDDGVFNYSFQSYCIPTNIIFHNNLGVQTVDLTFENNKLYYYELYTVNYVNASDISNVHAYTYGNETLGSWHGTPMIKLNNITIDDHDVYTLSYKKDGTSSNVIFNNNNSSQTGNLEFSDGKLFYVTVGSGAENTPTDIKITLSSTGMSTLSLPYALDFSSTIDGLDAAYIVSGLSASSATLTKVTEIPANTGVLLKGTANATITIPYKSSATLGDKINYLKPTLGKPGLVKGSGSVYVLNSGEFHPANTGIIPVFKAYIDASDIPSGARALSLSFDDTTGITAIKSGERKTNEVYNLAGQRMAKTTKGLYVLNGKKVIIK